MTPPGADPDGIPRRAVVAAVMMLVVALRPGAARGDGGAVRLSQQVGPYRVTVFTAPTPLRAGPVDVSVFVQDGAGGAVLPDVTVRVTLTPAGGPGAALEARATHEAATNKLFQAAAFELPAPGRWKLAVAVEGPRGPAECACEVEAEAPPPRWVELWPWFAWPAVPVVLFVLHQALKGKGRQGHGGRGRSPRLGA
jgi:hypothetical protein